MKSTLEHAHPQMCILTRGAKLLFRDATDLQYQILLITTAVDHRVSQ